MIENKNAKARLPECFKKKQSGKNVGELAISIGAEEQIEIEEDSFEIKVHLNLPPLPPSNKMEYIIMSRLNGRQM